MKNTNFFRNISEKDCFLYIRRGIKYWVNLRLGYICIFFSRNSDKIFVEHSGICTI